MDRKLNLFPLAKALVRNFVDISLFNADPLPRLSVHVGTTCTLVRLVAGVSPKKSIKLMRIARASSVEITRARFPSRISTAIPHT